MTTNNTQPMVEFKNVVKDYPRGLFGSGGLRAIDGVSLRVEPGEIFGLLGPNRAGKTTLVKLLLGLCFPSAGEVFRFGQPTTQRDTLRRVGYVHENQAFPRYLSARALLEFYGAMSLLPEPIVKARVPILLQRIGLDDRADDSIACFSKGMVQRLGIAQALLNEPDLLVLDEPSEGLDLEGRLFVRNLVKEQKSQGKSVLFVSHVLSEMELFCDRIGIIVGGKIAYLGALSDLLNLPSGATRPLEAAVTGFYPVRDQGIVAK